MSRRQVPLPTLTELLLVLAALLGGASIGHALELPATMPERPAPAASRSRDAAPVLALAPPASPASPAGAPRWSGLPMTWRDDDRTPEADAGDQGPSVPDDAADSAAWRQELQLAAWSHPAEAPAGAGRYPLAGPGGDQRDDLRGAHASSAACRGQDDTRCLLSETLAATHGDARISHGQGETRTALWITMPTSIGSTSPP